VERNGCHAGNADRLPAQTVNLSYGLWPGRGPPSRKRGSFALCPRRAAEAPARTIWQLLDLQLPGIAFRQGLGNQSFKSALRQSESHR